MSIISFLNAIISLTIYVSVSSLALVNDIVTVY